jgi:SAM-dependent methyltransferase
MNPSPSHASAGQAAASASSDARKSHGLQTLVASMAAKPHLYVLDLGGPAQENIDFVTGAGHKLYVDDLLYSYDYFFSPKEQAERNFRAGRIEEFIDSALTFDEKVADSILIWDRLQYLPPAVAEAVVERLRRILLPGGLLLSLFRTDSSGVDRPPYSARILDGQTLLLREQARPRPIETFNPRTIHKLFQNYGEVRFFVSRESLQEVLIRR